MAELFGIAFARAHKLCAAFGLDPHEESGPFEWERLEALLYGDDAGLDEEEWTRVTGEDPPPADERYQEEKS